MPYDSQGKFYRVHNWEQDRINEIEIVSDRHDEEDDNFAEGLSSCLLKDGRTAMTGKLNMNNFKIQNVANATASKDAVNKSQLDAVSSVGVKLSGNQTIGGNKTFSGTTTFNVNPTIKNTAPTLVLNCTDVIKGQAPTDTQYTGVSFRDASGDRTGTLSRVLAGYMTNKDSFISLYAFQCDSKPNTEDGLVGAGLTMHYPASGDPYATCHYSDIVDSVVTTKSINKAAKGHVELGNGIIINWVKRTQTGSFTWSKAFTNADSYTIAADAAIGYSKTGGTSVNITDFHYGDSNKPDTVTLIAIGY